MELFIGSGLLLSTVMLFQIRKVMDPTEGLQSVRLQRAQNPDYDLKAQKSAMQQLMDMRKEVHVVFDR